MKSIKDKKGFTLVELMIVVVIMGILVAIAVPVYGAITRNAETKTCYTNNEIIEKSGTQFMITTGEASSKAIFLDGTDNATITSQQDAVDKLDPRFLSCFDSGVFPLCPSGSSYKLEVNYDNDERTIKVTCSTHGNRK